MVKMGQNNSKSTFRSRLQSRLEAWGNAASGVKLFSCSLEHWVHYCNVENYGFQDFADYTSRREDFTADGLIFLRPDVTEGRYIRACRSGPNRINLEEKQSGMKISVEIEPGFTSGTLQRKTCLDHHFYNANIVKRPSDTDVVAAVVGCHGNLAVVQVMDPSFFCVPQFFFIEMHRQVSLGKLTSDYPQFDWYECHISPDKSFIILRSDVRTLVQRIITTLTINKIQVMIMGRFPGSGNHILTFDNRHGHRYVFQAKDKDIELFDFHEMAVIKSNCALTLPTNIGQIKSSPSGCFLAVRCVYPDLGKELMTNTIVILEAETIGILFSVDVRGPYCGKSELVNRQVFPRFSLCETGIAVMRHKASKHEVTVYKLSVLCSSLQHFSRRLIRCYVRYCDLPLLPLPTKLIEYLRYEHS